MTDQELDAMMKRVLLDAIKVEWNEKIDALPDLQLSTHRQRTMQEMLADPLGWARRQARPVWKKVLQRVAAVVIVCSLTLGSLMAISPTVRAAVIRWVTEWYETHIVYRYSGESISAEMPQYEITELPDGYKETDRIEDIGYVSIVYENADGKYIYLDYAKMEQGAGKVIETGDSNVIQITVNGLSGQLFLPQSEDQDSTITWINPNSNLQFSVDGFFNKDDMLHIAESVSLVESTK